MSSPESKVNNYEIGGLIGDNFLGRDIVSIEQLDKKALSELAAAAAKIEAAIKPNPNSFVRGLHRRATLSLFENAFIVSAVDEMGISDSKDSTLRARVPFESAFVRFGGHLSYQELVPIDEPGFVQEILDIKACLPDAVLVTHPDPRVFEGTAEIFRRVEGNVPVINTKIFQDPEASKCAALLALVLGKIK